VKVSGGVKVKKISAGIFRNQTAMTEGFVITKVDKKPIASAKELEKIIKATKGVVLIEGIYPADSEAAYYGINLGEE
jgi:S1-C subfamily serine protease